MIVKCDYCNKEFKRIPSQIRDRVYCSRECCNAHKREVYIPLKKQLNQIEVLDDYAIVYTSNGDEILVDKEDLDKIKKYTWGIGAGGYALTRIGRAGKTKGMLMHRLIMNPNKNMEIDHINHNKIDNRKHNLRECTAKDNLRYQKLRRDNVSGVTGVGYFKKTNKWRARIYVDGKEKSLGLYDKKEDAIKARIDAEEKYFGEFGYQASNQ